MNDRLRAAAEAWSADDPDPATRAELRELLDAGDEAGLADRFGGRLRFGTAGLRGPLRAGPAGMNRAVVRRTAAGLAAVLRSQRSESDRPAGPVVIGYDARHGSAQFARDSAAVLAGAGLDARLLPRPLPTPVLAYAVRRLGAAAGVMVTASHNPSGDNGYKVYAADGAQIVPPFDARVEAAAAAVGPLSGVPLSERYAVLGDDLLDGYLDAVASVPRTAHRELAVVHTALHGVGGAVLAEAFRRAGFAAPVPVPEQAEPDPDFPTVVFPNPEEPGAVDLGLALAARVGADLMVATDPDADRCAVGVPGRDGAGWRLLSGDELGLLLADHLLRSGGASGTYATTIVSSSQLRALCAARGARYAETLTGFKWIVRAAPDLRYGYEEALGYCVLPDVVRDKDGVSAALLAADLAGALRVGGRTLLDRLDELAAELGVFATAPASVRVADLGRIDAAMRRLRADPPRRLLGRPVTVDDLLPDADVVRLRADGCRVVVRPSGTEPKLKAYLEVAVPPTPDVPGARRAADADLARLRAEISPLLTG